jgi:glycosyltransferase involved in cell wall biosynthesis
MDTRSTTAPPAGLVSLVVPLHNEEDSVVPLADAVKTAMEAWPEEWELILVDDGSTDETLAAAARLPARDRRIRVVALARNYGQSKAMQAGFDEARGNVVVSLDGDLQNDPRDIPLLLAKLEEGYDLVAGYRVRRQDALLTRLVPSWVANRLVGWATGVPIRDNGCSLKAYRREVLDQVRLYSEMHRFIPALAVSLAGAAIAEVPVRHHARRFGSSKYGLSRVGQVAADILTLVMIRSYREQPLALFGQAGIAVMLLSLLPLGVWVGLAGERLVQGSMVVMAGISLAMVGLAIFLFMLGFVAETVLRAEQELEPGGRLIVRRLAA